MYFLDGQIVPLDQRKLNEHTYYCAYQPTKAGKHTVNILFNKEEVPKSPFEVINS